MVEPVPPRLKQVLSEKIADSIRSPLPQLTPRRVFGAIQLPGKATAVVGMRRAGKTTYLHQLRGEKAASGQDREQLPYLSFEDERLAGLSAGHLGAIVEEYERRFPDASERSSVTWCFDEIQLVPGWERFVRRLLDTGGNEIFVTGSSAALLSREIATALRARAWEVLLHPFSFEEALRHQGHEIPAEPEFLGSRERLAVERAFLKWLEVGGFPEAQALDAPSRYQLLRDYVDVAMLRDVVERHGVSNVAGLRWLVRHLLGNAASRFSVEKFYAALKSQGLAISKDTIHQLLRHLEDCFLVRMVWMESSSERQRMVNPRKAYPVDSGLIPVFDRTGRANIDHALEAAVLVELERRRFSVTYVRTSDDHEVDFLARTPDGKAELIQACADVTNPLTVAREMGALIEAGVRYPKAGKRLLTLTRDAIPSEVPTDVAVHPAYEWMLSAK